MTGSGLSQEIGAAGSMMSLMGSREGSQMQVISELPSHMKPHYVAKIDTQDIQKLNNIIDMVNKEKGKDVITSEIKRINNKMTAKMIAQ